MHALSALFAAERAMICPPAPAPAPFLKLPGPADHFHAGVSADSHLYEVRLDGRRLPLCVEARADQGWARVYRTDAGGAILLDFRDRPLCDTLRGHVRIVLAND